MLLDEALSARVAIDAIYVEGSAEDEPAVRRAASAGVPVREVAAGALAKVLDLKTPRGVVAVVRAAPVALDELLDRAVDARRPVLVVVALQDPGNLGTLVRVAEAAGCAGVVATPGSVDLHNPKTVRATAGAVFRVPVAEQVELDELFAACRQRSVPTFATVGRGGAAPDAATLGGAVAVLIGAEAQGLAPTALDGCDATLTIPMEGAVESLNAAIAGSVVLFEAARQRRSVDTPASSSTPQADPVGGEPGAMGHNEPTVTSTADPQHWRTQR